MSEALILDDQLRSFGSLVGLLLALITLFTGQRWAAVKELEKAPGGEWLRAGGWALDSMLLLLTLALFLSGLPLALDALSQLEFLQAAGALKSAFVAVWIALLGLMAWQVALIVRSVGLAWDMRVR